MRDKKRRARTGCLTCRVRRVKCDEGVPECRRCMAANVACAGYEQPRVVVPDRHQSSELRREQRRPLEQVQQPLPPLLQQQQQQGNSLSSSSPASPPRRSVRDDAAEAALSFGSRFGLQTVRREPAIATTSILTNPTTTNLQAPLIAFPSGPRRNQRPSPGARHVLGYHQVHLRTLPILFAPKHLPFWQDKLLQEAWGCDYLYLTLVALGNIHRAALMTVAGDEHDQGNDLDMKITAVQLYTQALESLAEHLEEAKRTPVLLVAALCLMAYFEAFSGNIPAFIGRTQAADHYFTTLLPAEMRSISDDRCWKRDLAQLQDCLRSMWQTCYVTLPLKSIRAVTEQYLDASYHETVDGHTRDSSARLAALHSLVDLVSEDHDIEELIWSPIAPYARGISAQAMRDFDRKLEHWKTGYLHLIPELDTQSALSALLVYRWSTFAMPPPAYESMTRQTSLAAAHYNFYKARIRWALLLLGDDEQRNKLAADFYFYEALRHAASHVSFLAAPASYYSATMLTSRMTAGGSEDGPYIPCEALRVGLLPVLHITGLCSPEHRWLEWIKELSHRIVQEGVLKGHTFATNLECLHIFETHRHKNKHSRGGGRNSTSYITSSSPPPLEQYPAPADRIICQLIPETDGRHFTTFFAAPALSAVSDDNGVENNDDNNGGDGQYQSGLTAYRVIGDARWRCGYGEVPCTPVCSMYDEDSSTILQPFSTDWLYGSQPVRDWLSWSREKEFCMERALQDHINGTRLLLAR